MSVPDLEASEAVVLVTGAGGYVGGRLVESLLASGIAVRAAGRDERRLGARWRGIDSCRVDVLDPATIPPALEGVGVAYYLIHSMSEGEEGFEERDRVAAANFANAARDAGVGLVVYLGGLGSDAERLSPHLASRHETGRVLAEQGPPVLEFRAGMVIGSGSASYRMLRDLVKRLPLMITPRWVRNLSQPIAVDDVVSYLRQGLSFRPAAQHTIVEVGGPDAMSYKDMMLRAAALSGRRPLIVTVPVLTPRLSSLWCGLVTSVPASIARPLIEGLRNETVVREPSAPQLFPDIHPVGFEEALRRASTEG
jgi:uncharacterized protein YbjT (DUF2867 family)